MDFGDVRLRRAPAQERSRHKVEQALAAAERVLDRDGPDGLTVTAVAAEAGLAVGTLHQYLPDREAITAALADIYHGRLEDAMAGVVAAVERGADPVEATLAAMAQEFRRSAGVRALRAGRTHSDSVEHRARMIADVAALMFPGADPPHPALLSRAAFVAVDSLVREAFAEDPDGDPALLREASLLASWFRDRAARTDPGPVGG